MTDQFDPIDETTDMRGLAHDRDVVREAEQKAAQAVVVMREYRGLAQRIREMHQENHYTPRLRRLFRGESSEHPAAS